MFPSKFSMMYFILVKLILLTSVRTQAQSSKYALVIGAKGYTTTSAIRNSASDAKLMADVL